MKSDVYGSAVCFHCGNDRVCSCMQCAPDEMKIGPCVACKPNPFREKQFARLDELGLDIRDSKLWTLEIKQAPARNFRRLREL